MTNPSTKQLTDDRHDHVTMDAVPSTALKVIPTQFLFGFAKTRFHLPASERDSQQLANRPAITTGNSIADEVLHFSCAEIFRHDQRTGFADKLSIVRLSITSMPLNVPNLRAFLRISHAVTLWCLITKAR